MIKFKQKDFSSFKEDIIEGTIAGSSIGAALSTVLKKKAFIKYGALIGAGLGALAGTVKWMTSKVSGKVDSKRSIDQVVNSLVNLGYKENLDFTKDPKMANLLKTKVCVVFSKTRSEFKLLVNMVNNEELKRITNNSINKIPKSGYPTVTEKTTDRFNEIQVISLPSEKDLNILTGIIRDFIKKGYPVYIVEVS